MTSQTTTLAQRIEADLATRLASGQPLPCPLKLIPLATYYGVSTRPVREALAQLRRRRLLTPKTLANLRVQDDAPCPEPHHLQGGPAEHQQAMATLTRHLVSQSLQPGSQAGEGFLRETVIAAQLGVSTTVVREMFSRLVGSGLLEHVPRRGWRVRPVSQKDLDDFIQARHVMEALALRLAWGKLDLSVIRQFLQGNQLGKKGERAVSDNTFHGYIIMQADNYYISDFFSRHGRYFELLFEWEEQDTAAARQTVQQHRRILQAILRNDPPAALKALETHILDNHPVLNRLLSRQGG